MFMKIPNFFQSPLGPRILIGVAILVLVILSATTVILREHEGIVITRFGKPVRVLQESGLHWKMPWPIESIFRVDQRLDFLEVRISEALTEDKRNVILPVYLMWRPADPLKYLQTVGARESAATKLDALVTSARNEVLGSYSFPELLSRDGQDLQFFAMEQQILERVKPQAAGAFGIEVVSIGFKQITLPEANTRFVFRRMTAERTQHAARFRAEGKQQANEIRAKTDAEKAAIIADARQYAEEKSGIAEAKAAEIYADAHSEDPEFYRFLRELQVLREVVGNNTTLVLDADAPPFRLLKDAGESRSEPEPPEQGPRKKTATADAAEDRSAEEVLNLTTLLGDNTEDDES